MRDTHDNGGARRNGTRAGSLREFTGDCVALSSLPGLAAAAAAYKLIISRKRVYYVRFGARVGGGDGGDIRSGEITRDGSRIGSPE